MPEKLNDNEFFRNVVDTPKEGAEQHKKREVLKSVIDKGKLGHKWTHERVDKTSDETINKVYAAYRQRELNEKGKKTGKDLGKHVINLYFTGISRWLKIKNAKKLQQDIENDPIIKDQMARLGCHLVCTFGNLLALVLVAAHMVNNLDLGDEPEDEGYENEAQIKCLSVVHKIWPSPWPKDVNKMIDLFKNTFWYIIEGACTVLLHMLKYVPVVQEAYDEAVVRRHSPLPDI